MLHCTVQEIKVRLIDAMEHFLLFIKINGVL
ncbi:hypothetical protein CLV53_101419 [Sediminibacterium magnilacihabitans]|nr:hypothetical protein CLV53_101419 [Sediminibacterium magnilacihabitans]